MIIDIARCQDCNNCFISCKDEHWENDHMPIAKAQPRHGHRWIDIDRLERGQYPLQDVAYLPHLCMHCEDAPCMKGITDGTIYKRPDGIVIIDPVKAKGEKALAASCPYGAIYWNEESQLAQKCTMCASPAGCRLEAAALQQFVSYRGLDLCSGRRLGDGEDGQRPGSGKLLSR